MGFYLLADGLLASQYDSAARSKLLAVLYRGGGLVVRSGMDLKRK